MDQSDAKARTRRDALKALAGLGVGTLVFQRSVAARAAQEGRVTPDQIKEAEWIAGLELTDEERQATARALERSLRSARALRALPIGWDVPPCLTFQAVPGLVSAPDVARNQARLTEDRPPVRPKDDEALAFLPVTELSALLRARVVTSMELTEVYIGRLKKFDPLLKCVVNLTEAMAFDQAARADSEIASGRWRGPLHGVPWGAKDLIAVPGVPTTWGAPVYKDQVFDKPAVVARRLEEAGAVLVAKLSLGALAMGDQWHGGMTRNPWDPKTGSSGSSAGPASAVTAGLVGFAIGSETLGSIVSPARTCGTTGLRPTFGRISRAGCMALSWSMDKLGPMARSVEDCALVLDAVHGSDGGDDPGAVDRPFAWPVALDWPRLKVGFLPGGDEAKREELNVLRGLGAKLVPIALPNKAPAGAITTMLDVEAGASFDKLTRDHVTEGLNSWPTTFRQAQFVTAIEYLRASRARTLLVREMAELMDQVDLYVAAAGVDLAITNLTGSPSVVVPSGLARRGESGGRPRPVAIAFTGRPFDESRLLAVAMAYQNATGHHLRRPPLERFLAEDAPVGPGGAGP